MFYIREIRVGNMKFRCVEGLFNPGLYGKDDVSLHHIVERSIKACDMDQRRELCRNIYLSGGSSCISGKERFVFFTCITCFLRVRHVFFTCASQSMFWEFIV